MSIQFLINERGLKQYWVAQKIGIKPNRLSAITRGRSKLPIDKVTPLASVLGVTTAELVQAANAATQSRIAESLLPADLRTVHGASQDD